MPEHGEETAGALYQAVQRRMDGPSDPDNALYCKCSGLFLDALDNKPDMCSGALLERAYLWALACKLRRFDIVPLGGLRVEFQCQAIAPARIFNSDTSKLMEGEVGKMKPRTLYYADERRSSHPRADMWFKTDDNRRLILLEIGGTSSTSKAKDKVQTFTSAVQGSTNISVQGVVLLPNVEAEMESTSGAVTVVTGDSAKALLGGLAQLLTWLGDAGE